MSVLYLGSFRSWLQVSVVGLGNGIFCLYFSKTSQTSTNKRLWLAFQGSSLVTVQVGCSRVDFSSGFQEVDLQEQPCFSCLAGGSQPLPKRLQEKELSPCTLGQLAGLPGSSRWAGTPGTVISTWNCCRRKWHYNFPFRALWLTSGKYISLIESWISWFYREFSW